MKNNDITEVVILENTRPLYTAVENLHRQFLTELGDQDLGGAERLRSLEDFLAIPHLLKVQDSKQDEKSNHPYAAFLSFLAKESMMGDNVEETVRDLLRLYEVLYYLSIESLERVRYPDAFERLCNCMCKNMDSSVCYLLYSQRNHIELLSTSVFPDDMVVGPTEDQLRSDSKIVPTQLTLNDFNEVRRYIHRVRALKSTEHDTDSWSIADTIYHPNVGENHLLVMVIDFPRYPKDKWKDEYIYIIFQRAERFPKCVRNIGRISADANDNEKWREWIKLITQCRNVLFLRNQILEQCMRKLYILMSSQRSYQYVKRLSAESDPLRILHLTDMHISENLRDQMKTFLQILEQRKVTVDLIVITGDVIQGSSSAGAMEERYQQAARFIRQIVTKLWSENGHVRTDWRKRIIIVPGNHDYATMNELQAMSLPGELRSTGLGYPARKDGGPMVKFTYYIKFLCDLLGMDINEMVTNDLNEARRYQRMGLTVYGINTVSEIGPLRNNKVSIKLDAVKRLTKTREAGNRFNLILSHHSPFYDPDYLMDRYGIWNMGIEVQKQRDWISRFSAELHTFDTSGKTNEDREICKQRLGQIKAEIVSAMTAEKHWVEDSTCDLLWDVSGAIRTLDENTGFNERLSLLHHTITREEQMMQRDKRLLDEAYRELMREIGFHMCLSGHTHQFRSHFYTDPFEEKMEPKQEPEKDRTEILCVEGNRMFSEDRIAYGIVEVDLSNPEKQCVHWKGYSNKNTAAQIDLNSVF